MIRISDNKNKRSDICQIDYIRTSMASIRDYPGNEIYIAGDWLPIRFSSANFQETDETNGEPVAQELSIKISGSEKEAESIIRDLCGQEILLRLQYSNGDVKVVGTDDNPVYLSHSAGGSPVASTISFKRNSAERAKHLKSF